MASPAYEHAGTPRSGDSRQPMNDWCSSFCIFFSLPPVLHGNGRQEKSFIMQAAIGASPGPANLSLSAARSDLSRPSRVLAAQEDQSRLSVSVCARRLYLPAVCLTLLPRYKSQPLMHEAVRLGSGSLAGQV